jgi:hypothetical protein
MSSNSASPVLSPDGARGTIRDDLDFFDRDRAAKVEIEVVLGDLGDELSQRFFDELEYWDAEKRLLVDELDARQPNTNEN